MIIINLSDKTLTAVFFFLFIITIISTINTTQNSNQNKPKLKAKLPNTYPYRERPCPLAAAPANAAQTFLALQLTCQSSLSGDKTAEPYWEGRKKECVIMPASNTMGQDEGHS